MPEATLEYAVATLTDGSKVRTPYWRIESGKEGEAFLVLAAQHGNEVQGCEVIRRFKAVCEQQLVAGSVWLVPFANVPALRHRRSHISLGPEQPYADDRGHNMNRTWSGNPEGNDTERLSYSIHEAVVRHCTRCLDLHSWSRFTATATLARKDGGLCEEIARATAIRFVLWRSLQLGNTPGQPTTIGALFNGSGRASATIELAPQWVIRPKEVALGLRAATNMAKLFGMIEGEMELLDEQVSFERNDEADQERIHVVKAPCAGLFVEAGLETSDRVEEGLRRQAIAGGVHILAPECAVPLTAPLGNLRVLVEVAETEKGRP